MTWDEEGASVFGPDGHLVEAAAHAFVDGAYPDADAARVVLHVRECARCAALVAEARGLVAAAAGVLRTLDDGPAAAGGVTPAVVRAVDGQAPRPGQVTRGMPRAGLRAAAAALIVAGLGGGMYAAEHPRQVRPVPAARVFEAPDSAGAGTAAMAPALAAPMMARPAMVPAPTPRPAPRVAIAKAASPVPRPLAAAPTASEPRPASPSRAVRSDRWMRRSGFQLPDVRGCYDVAGTPDTTGGVVRGAALPSSVRLGDGGQIASGGSVRGAWTLIAPDSLRVRWTDAGGATVMLRYDGARWAGNGVRLTPSADAGVCGEP